MGRGWFWDWIGVPVIGGIAITFFFCPGCVSESDYKEFAEGATISAIFWALLANGNHFLVKLLDKHWSWIEYPVKRFSISFIATVLFTFACSFVVLYSFIEFYFDLNFIAVMEKRGWWDLFQTPVIITIVISTVLHGRNFLFQWREAALNVEKLKNQSLSSKFESLKNQINPHFLFNSLNALSSLVHSDQDKATQFIQKLSEVYRYVLDHQYDEVVPAKIEVEFAKSYVYLNKIRFGKNLQVNFNGINLLNREMTIPALSLQMLVENCIKHNEISKDFPLTIDISSDDDYLVVKNNLNPLESPKRDSNGVGLSNIINRYSYLSDHEVMIDQTENQFSVSIPLLNVAAP